MTTFLLTYWIAASLILTITIITDWFWRNSPVKQDLLWRTTILILLFAPGLLLIRQGDGLLTIPVPTPWKSADPIGSTATSEPSPSASTIAHSVTALSSTQASTPFAKSNANLDAPTSAAPLSVNLQPTVESPTLPSRTLPPASLSAASPLPPSPKGVLPNWPTINLEGLLFGLLLAGTTLQAAFLITGCARLRKRLADSRSIESGPWKEILTRESEILNVPEPSLRFATRVTSPMLYGLLRPALIIPAHLLSESNSDSIRHIVRHELGHLQRRDHWFNALVLLLQFVLWMNPLFYWMRRRVYWLRELICDLHVIQCQPAVEYAETLFRVSCSGPADGPSLAVNMAQPTSILGRRITFLLEHTHQQGSLAVNGTQRRLAAIILPVVFVFACIRFTQATTPLPSPALNSPSVHSATVAQEDAGIIVKGRVTKPDGKGASQATVYLLTVPEESFILPTQPDKAIADANGYFRFLAPEGKYRIWSESDQWTTLEKSLAGQELVLSKNDSAQTIDLQLHEGCSYNVTVTDAATSQPISNAEISFGWADIDRRYRTDGSGKVRIQGLAKKDWYFVVVAEGYGTTYRKLPAIALGSSQDLAFEMGPGVTLKGTVTDLNGIPVANATIGATEDTPMMTPNLARTTTNADGRFEMRGFPVGMKINLGASCQDYERTRTTLVIPSAADGIVQHDIQMSRRPYGGDCLVTVVDELGQPISGASLHNMGTSSSEFRDAITDQRGRGLMEDILTNFSGNSAVVRADGYIPQLVELKAGTRQEPGSVTVKLIPGKTLKGRLLKPDQTPAANVRIYYNDGESGSGWLGGRVKTDSEGRFEIRGLPDPSTFTVYSPSGYSPINRLELPVGQSEEVTIHLSKAASLRAVAVDANTDRRIDEFRVQVLHVRPRTAASRVPRGVRMEWITRGFVVTENDEAFELGDLETGVSYGLRVTAEGYLPQFVPEVVTKVHDDSTEPLKVKLRPESEAEFTQVTGTLLDDEQTPVPNAIVYLAVAEKALQDYKASIYSFQQGRLEQDPDCTQFLKTTTDRDGAFTFPKVRDEKWMQIVYESPQIGEGLLILKPNDRKSVEIRAIRPGKLVVQWDSKTFPEVRQVTILPKESKNPLERTSQSALAGRSEIEFDRIPPGKYVVKLQKTEPGELANMIRSIERASKEVEVLRNETTKLKFQESDEVKPPK